MSESSEEPSLTVLRDAAGTVLRMEWTKAGMYFAFNGDEVQQAIDAMSAALASLGERGGQDAVAIELFSSAYADSPGDFV